MSEEKTQPSPPEPKSSSDSQVPGDTPSQDLPEFSEDMNSTMMAIDISKLSAMDATRTSILTGSPLPRDGENTDKELDTTDVTAKSYLWKKLRFFFEPRSRQKPDDDFSPKKRWALRFEPFVGIWLFDRDASPFAQTLFILTRLLILLSFGTTLALLVPQALVKMTSSQTGAFPLTVLAFLPLLFAPAIFSKRLSPVWLVLGSGLAWSLLTMGLALFYHTADASLFSVFQKSLSLILSPLWLVSLTFLFLLCASECWNSKKVVWIQLPLWIVTLGLLMGAWSFPWPLEQMLGDFPGIPAALPFFLQPLSLLIQIFLPLLALLQIPFLFRHGKKFSRQTAWVVFLLLMAQSAAGFSLLQKNRIFHAFNSLWPMRLEAGSIEVQILSQSLKIETINMRSHEGQDDLARYRLTLERSKKSGEYLLSVRDHFGFPVSTLTSRDIRVLLDNKPVQPVTLERDTTSLHTRGRYRLSFKSVSPRALVTWDKKSIYERGDPLTFNIAENQKIHRFKVLRDNDLLAEFSDSPSGTLSVPTFYFENGVHTLRTVAEDEFGQILSEQDIRFTVKHRPELFIIAPQNGDSIAKQAALVLWVPSTASSEIQNMNLTLDGKPWLSSVPYAGHLDLDFSSLDAGSHTLEISLRVNGQPLKNSVTFEKKSEAPQLEIAEPLLGVFSERETPLVFSGGKISPTDLQGITVRVNGSDVTSLVQKEKNFRLPTSRWESSELWVSIQAKFPDGSLASDWVQFNAGASQLHLNFDLASLAFLKVSSMDIILDGSVSSLDNWQGRTKWQSALNVLLSPEIETRLKSLSPSFLVFGSQFSFYENKCDDVIVPVGSKKNFESMPRLKPVFDKISPRGLSTIVPALEKSYAHRPEKILLFADSSDSCTPNLKQRLAPLLKSSPKTQINVIALGEIAEKDKKQLVELAETTSGKFYQPKDYNTLVNALLEQLSLQYELTSAEKVLVTGPLENRVFDRLAPGNYKLKIPYGTQIKEYDFTLENGTSVELSIRGDEESGQHVIHIDQKVGEI